MSTMSVESGRKRPLTRRQRTAIMQHFKRLGLADRRWRPERLAITSALATRRHVASVNDLTLGEAGRLVNALARCRDCRDLAVLLAAETLGLYDETDPP